MDNLSKLIVLVPGQTSQRLDNMLKYSLENYEYEIIKTLDKFENMRNRRILFAVELGDTGINIELYKMLEKINKAKGDFFNNSAASIIINSTNEFHTRDVERKIILYANMSGCAFPGRPVSEATGSLQNFSTYKKVQNIDLIDICYNDCKKTVKRLMNFDINKVKNPHILTLHSSNYKTSNTLTLWQMVKDNLEGNEINEIHIENGSVRDCKGCSYKACKHYSESTNCFYGGVMVEEVYPAILDCDILIMLCPNYNDAISANMSAVINRLTALFRKTKFYDKYFYAVIVSGHSGSDIVAQQLISSLNINKTFMLPPKFALMETANDIGDIEKVDNIREKAAKFANNIKNNVID